VFISVMVISPVFISVMVISPAFISVMVISPAYLNMGVGSCVGRFTCSNMTVFTCD
jgi:hypothetical protein